uniref:Uncharacterized protein n=1 Tax=uncultured Thiotrichaceae bacterium TaxID=298394 RepID=A0A6S6UM83_9GAMM|nr:MAG: Unknown protein [uncultured Thiotrichaceae bacterium]
MFNFHLQPRIFKTFHAKQSSPPEGYLLQRVDISFEKYQSCNRTTRYSDSTKRPNMEYTNRKGKTYYLYAGTTKTGKPRYYSSSKDSSNTGTPLEQLPEGYEIYERPENAQVFIRKQRPRLITEIEEQFIKKQLSELHQPGQYIVDCKDESLTIYESARISDLGDDEIPRTDMSQGDYTAVLRFCLCDKETRAFTAERFCFRGSIDDWIHAGGPDSFQNIITQYLKYLGTDQFYELPYL